MIRALLTAALLALFAASAVAKTSTAAQTKTVTMGGIDVLCGSAKSEAADEAAILAHAEAKDSLKVNRFDKETGQKFIAQLNDEGAADDPSGPIVAERVIIIRGPTESILAIVSGGRFCMFPAASNKTFDYSADKAFGSGS